MKLTQQEKDKIREEFENKFCTEGSFGEKEISVFRLKTSNTPIRSELHSLNLDVQDFWLSKIDSILEERVAKFLENKAKEKDNKLDSYRAMQIIANTLIKIIPCKK